MSKISHDNLARYQKMLEKDPKSKAFALLAECYREMGMLDEATTVAQKGIQKHPHYVGGHLVIGKVYIDQKKLAQAESHLKMATELDPQNILALQMLGTVYVHLKKIPEALRVFKLSLFLNPLNDKAKKAVQKLESMTSQTDFQEDEFKMVKPQGAAHLNRQISILDAFVNRGEFDKAKSLFEDLILQYPENLELRMRQKRLAPEASEPIRPIASRQKAIINKKILVLSNVLKRIQSLQV